MAVYVWSWCWTETLINAVWSCPRWLIVLFSSIVCLAFNRKIRIMMALFLKSVAFLYCSFRDSHMASCVLLIFGCFTIFSWSVLNFYFYIIVQNNYQIYVNNYNHTYYIKKTRSKMARSTLKRYGYIDTI
jgi:hypothetical protein